MKKILSCIIAFSFILGNLSVDVSANKLLDITEQQKLTDKERYEDYIRTNPVDESEHQIIVKMREDVIEEKDEVYASGRMSNNISLNEAVSDKLNLNEMCSVISTIISNDITVVETGSQNINEILEELNNNDNVIYAQPDYKVITTQSDINNKQWAIQNYGQTVDGSTGEEGFDISLLEAWNVTQGAEDIIVGVIDTGIDINHPDLKDSIWTNEKELNNGSDTDGNGYVDDIHGWDFVNNDSSVYDMDVIDEHGTHMGGIIAANGNVKGVAPNIKIMPLKALSYSSGYTSDIIEAIEYAKGHGVKIINCSFASIQYNPALEEAIASNPDILFVCAAGNYGVPTTEVATFPACYDLDNIISVSASNNKGQLSEISTYGEYIDIAAPGIGIYSTLPENKYGYKDGTSCSSAYISGVAALILSDQKDLTAIEVKNKIINSANSDLPKQSESGDSDSESEGMVNARFAFDASGVIGKYDNFKYTNDIGEYKPFIKYPFEFICNDGIVKIIFDTTKRINGIKLKIYEKTDEKNTECIVNDNITAASEYMINNIQSNIEYNVVMKIIINNIACEYSGSIKYIVNEETEYLDYDILYSQQYKCLDTELANNETVFEIQSAGVKWEVESNNTFAKADTTYDDYDNYGYMNSASDVDYFKVKFNYSGIANFWLGNIPDNCDYDLYLYDEGGALLAKSCNGDNDAELISSYPVESNVFYYMKVEAYSGSSTSLPYMLRAKWYETPSSYESNDTINSAYVLTSANQTIKDTIASSDDVDYYKVVLSAKEVLDLKLTRPNSNYRFEVYKSTNLNQTLISTTGTTYTRELSSGTYYIKIFTVSGYSSSKYTLKVSHSPIGTITQNSYKSDTITGSNNAYYTLTLNNPVGLNIELSNYGSSDYDLYLYDEDYTEIGCSNGSGQIEEIEDILESGVYKIRILRYDGYDSSFSIRTSVVVDSDDSYLTVGTGYPSEMNVNDVKAVTVLAKNTGARAWKASNGYKLAALNDSTVFTSGDILLDSSDNISNGKSKSFIFNIIAPDIETPESYTMGWQMKHNALTFGDKITKRTTVTPDYETLTLNNIKYISGKAMKQRYTFTVTSAGKYVFRTFKYSTGCDTKLTLYNSSLTRIESNDDIYSGNHYSRIEANLSAGTYYIDVEEYNGKPIYCQLLAENYAFANLSVGNTVNVSNKYEGYYKFNVSSSGTYIITTKYYSENSDTYLILYNSETASNSYKIGENDNDLSNYSRISVDLDEGTYYIRATTYDYIKGGINKKVNCKLSLVQQSTVPATENEPKIRITYPSNGSTVRLYDGASLKIKGTSSNVRSVTIKVNNSNISGVKTAGNSFECQYIPEESGEYVISATGVPIYGGSNPTSTVRVKVLVNDDGDDFSTATTIKEGTERISAIDFVEDIDCYMFVPERSGTYSIHTLGDTDTVISVYNSKYVLLGYNDDDFTNMIGKNADVPLYLEKNETYYVMIHSAIQSSTGIYSLCVEKLSDDNTSYKILSLGSAKSGYIDYPEDEDVFVFYPEQTRNYTFKTLGASDTMGVVYDKDGNFMDFNDDISEDNTNCQINVYLEAGEQYFFAVKHNRSYMYKQIYKVIVE